MSEPILVLMTFPNEALAGEIATRLVEERLAVCVNLLPQARSIYRWEGKTESATETVGLAKTTLAAFPAFLERFEALHPYDTPECIVLPIVDGLPRYLDWITNELQ